MENNWTTSCTQNEAEQETDLTRKCDWKSDRKCSTWRMRRRFAAVLPSPQLNEENPKSWSNLETNSSPHPPLLTTPIRGGFGRRDAWHLRLNDPDLSGVKSIAQRTNGVRVANSPFHGFFNFWHVPVRKIRRHHWKERLKISTFVKFESDTSLAREDNGSSEELRNFTEVCMVGAQPCPHHTNICKILRIRKASLL